MRMRTTIAFLSVSLAFAVTARAEVKTQEVEYKAGDTPLKGFLAYDDAAKGKRPGVLVVHEWWGMNEHARNQAVRLAKSGYVALALDMYGNGKTTTHPEEAMAFTKEATKDHAVMSARFDAALDLLKKQPQVDPTKIAAIGYCFGGGVVLGEARSGADLAAVATFHGHLATDGGPSMEKGKFKGQILVMTGAADPHVPPDQVQAFEKEMSTAGVKFNVIKYPGVKHSFTNPNADKAGVPGLEYNAEADKKSWIELEKFLKHAFGS
jgi:dienelactone hydrolase